MRYSKHSLFLNNPLFYRTLTESIVTYTENIFDWFRSPNPNKTQTQVSNEFIIDIAIGYL